MNDTSKNHNLGVCKLGGSSGIRAGKGIREKKEEGTNPIFLESGELAFETLP